MIIVVEIENPAGIGRRICSNHSEQGLLLSTIGGMCSRSAIT
jgi:hypothetical protein